MYVCIDEWMDGCKTQGLVESVEPLSQCVMMTRRKKVTCSNMIKSLEVTNHYFSWWLSLHPSKYSREREDIVRFSWDPLLPRRTDPYLKFSHTKLVDLMMKSILKQYV
jgi:hypothetical protein